MGVSCFLFPVPCVSLLLTIPFVIIISAVVVCVAIIILERKK